MTSETSSGGRLFAVDALKGFAITCVVMGHAVLRTVAEPGDNALYLLLSAFEMPLFMFLSGYILPGRVRGSRLAWLGTRAVRLMVPFFAWHAIFFLSRRLDAFGTQPPAQVGAGLVRYLAVTFASPTAGLWYLPALLLCSAALALYFPLRTRPLVLLAVGWVTFAGLLLLRSKLGVGGDYGLLKTSTYWVFFSAGYAWGEWKRSMEPGEPKLPWLSALLYPIVAVPVMRALPEAGPTVGAVGKVGLGLAGTAFSAVLIDVGAPVARFLRLDRLGQLTLGVYCSQWLFLRADFGGGAAGVLALFTFTMAGSILVTWLIRKIPGVRGVLLGEWPKRRIPATQ